jgi:hypothetical protein
MSFLATCCGFYCALTSAVGIYFYLVLAIMEYKGSLTMKYIWNVESEKGEGDSHKNFTPGEDGVPDPKTKGLAFLILAGIELLFVVGCLFCANASRKADAEAEEENIRRAKQREYQQVTQNDGGNEQIMS